MTLKMVGTISLGAALVVALVIGERGHREIAFWIAFSVMLIGGTSVLVARLKKKT